MKHFISLLGLCLLVVAPLSAQTTLTATFTYGPINGSGTTCSDIISWTFGGQTYTNNAVYWDNGVETIIQTGAFCSGQADPDSGPEGFYSYLEIPFQFGFQNNGYWAATPTTVGPRVCNPNVGSGTCTVNGDQYSITRVGTSVYGTYTATSTYKVNILKSCRYGRCVSYYSDILLGGSGTATGNI